MTSARSWEGYVEYCTARGIGGWALERDGAAIPAEIAVIVDGCRVATIPAARRRPDIEAMFGHHCTVGFEFAVPPYLADGKLHMVSAVFARSGIELPGTPALAEFVAPDKGLSGEFQIAEGRYRQLALQELATAPPTDPATEVFFDRSMLPPARVCGPQEVGYQPWLTYAARFHGGFVNPAHGTLFDAHGRLWQACTYLRSADAIAQDRAAITGGQAVPTEASIVMFATSMARNYFHWHTDCLAGLYLIARFGGLDGAVLAAPPLTDWQRDSLALLGLPSPVVREGLCRADHVTVAAHIDGRGIFPDRAVRDMFDSLRLGVPPESDRRLFISRADAGSRVATNEDELAADLALLGFRRVVPGTLTYKEQLSLFAGAEMIVGTHGAGLTNIGVCRAGARILEIFEPGYRNPCYRHLAYLMGLRYAEHVVPDHPTFRIDVPAVLTAVQSALAR